MLPQLHATPNLDPVIQARLVDAVATVRIPTERLRELITQTLLDDPVVAHSLVRRVRVSTCGRCGEEFHPAEETEEGQYADHLGPSFSNRPCIIGRQRARKK